MLFLLSYLFSSFVLLLILLNDVMRFQVCTCTWFDNSFCHYCVFLCCCCFLFLSLFYMHLCKCDEFMVLCSLFAHNHFYVRLSHTHSTLKHRNSSLLLLLLCYFIHVKMARKKAKKETKKEKKKKQQQKIRLKSAQILFCPNEQRKCQLSCLWFGGRGVLRAT